jgi:hypothetical protein
MSAMRTHALPKLCNTNGNANSTTAINQRFENTA